MTRLSIRSQILFLVLGLALAGCSGRSIGNKIDDKVLGPEVSHTLTQNNPELSGPVSHIVVGAFNGAILLAGQTPREELKQDAARLAGTVNGVRKIYNEITIGPPSSGWARTNDASLTSSIKLRMFATSDVPGTRIKVITENGTVFMFGLVTQDEASAATRAVQSVSGVQKIVRLFEYTN